jgi:hypothetical protein
VASIQNRSTDPLFTDTQYGSTQDAPILHIVPSIVDDVIFHLVTSPKIAAIFTPKLQQILTKKKKMFNAYTIEAIAPPPTHTQTLCALYDHFENECKIVYF